MLEVCVDNIESTINAQNGGAARIELCSALSEGGLTPSAGTLKALKTDENITIPIFCMLRPRCGNDFQFTQTEIQSLAYDIEVLQKYGADGFVFGALDSRGRIDTESCRAIIQTVGDLPVTFHRAFDATDPKEMFNNAEIIRNLGFKRILTSGFKNTAIEGIENIKQLIAVSRGITIMPGSGINPENLERILLETRCTEFHTSSRIKVSTTDIESRQITNPDVVKELVKIARSLRF